MKTIRIATRASQLAKWQAHHVGDLITKHNPAISIEYLFITTTGDKITDKPLYEVGGKGLFLKEIEEALLSGEADLAVHSLKDVPFELAPGLSLAAILPREDARDALISCKGERFNDLKQGAKVGSSSLRRRYQLQALRPDLEFIPLRGNVDTRLRKVAEGQFDAIVLAAAGLKRLGLAEHIADFLPIIPSVGQGAIAIEIKSNDKNLSNLLKALHCAETETCVLAERAYLKVIQGGCDLPVACHVAATGDNQYEIKAYLAQPDGSNPKFESKIVNKYQLDIMSKFVAAELLKKS